MTIASWLNFCHPTPPGRGSAAGRKFLAPPYYSQRAVFACPLSAFSLSIEKWKLNVNLRLPQPQIPRWRILSPKATVKNVRSKKLKIPGHTPGLSHWPATRPDPTKIVNPVLHKLLPPRFFFSPVSVGLTGLPKNYWSKLYEIWPISKISSDLDKVKVRDQKVKKCCG